MATYDYIRTASDQFDGSNINAVKGNDKIFFARRIINLETAVNDLKAGTDFVQNDIIELIQIPIDTHVLAVIVKVTTASDTASDCDFGDGGDTTGYLDSISLTSTGTQQSFLTEAYSVAVGGGKIYTTADTIDLKFIGASAVDDGIFEITVIGWDLSVD